MSVCLPATSLSLPIASSPLEWLLLLLPLVSSFANLETAVGFQLVYCYFCVSKPKDRALSLRGSLVLKEDLSSNTTDNTVSAAGK